MSNILEERRKHPRHRIALKSKIAAAAISTEFDTLDLSINGLSCWLDHPINLFTKVEITLMVPQGDTTTSNHRSSFQRVECEGVVVRSEEGKSSGTSRFHTAIFFNQIKPDAMELIQRYVVSHKH